MRESIISGLAVPVLEQLGKGGRFLIGQARDARKDVQKIEADIKALKEYPKRYEDLHGQIKIMPGLMKDPMPLDSIYTAVKFLDDDSRRYFASAKDLEQFYREQGKRNFETAEKRHDGMSIAKEKPYLMVLGGPGIGKSTFLKKLGLESFKGKQGQLQSERIPIFIELKTLRSQPIDLVGALAKELDICGLSDARAFTELSLKKGNLLILLDGLDEVPTANTNRIIEKIEAFVRKYRKNAFVASCRTAAYHSSFKQFSDVTIADFDNKQIEQFIRRWFNSRLDQEADTANQYWQELKQPENKAAKELAQTPLLLTFLCLIYEREQELPNQRSTLYGRALDILLRDWSAQKRLERSSVYKYLRPEFEKELLNEIAYNSFEEDRLFFLKSDITDRINDYLSDTANIPAELDSSAVLEAIEIQQGILVERATDTYSFSHLTLQEYLTASYISSEWSIQKLVSEHLTDERWREVFLLVSGLAGRRSHELWPVMERQAIVFIKSPKLQGLLQWATELSDNSLSSNRVLSRSVLKKSAM